MSIAATMALLCFVSANPSPQHWLVSGSVEAVARLDAKVARAPMCGGSPMPRTRILASRAMSSRPIPTTAPSGR